MEGSHSLQQLQKQFWTVEPQKAKAPPRTSPLRVKPEVFPSNEIRPQVNSQQYADKLFQSKTTFLPNMKLIVSSQPPFPPFSCKPAKQQLNQ